MQVSKIIEDKMFVGLLQRTLNYVDTRLVDHGIRVSYIVYHMLRYEGYEKQYALRIALIALLHDIGAYKTDEINEMLKFESTQIWDHSIYGCLFIKHFSPYPEYADIILLHHVNANDMHLYTAKHKKEALYIHLADKIDLLLRNEADVEALQMYLEKHEGTIFSSESIQMFTKACMQKELLQDLHDTHKMMSIFDAFDLSDLEMDALLKLIVYTIDFRSMHTVTHTITTTRISYCCAKLCGLNETELTRVYYGAMLHDLGKIGIPVEILEFPGKLSSQAMKIMQTHVVITKDILGNSVEEETCAIACRHHEKLDGSGYPAHLQARSLNVAQRIVAISDIISALTGMRSYKDSFSKDKTIAIVKGMATQGKIDAVITDSIIQYYDLIMEEVEKICRPVLNEYMNIHQKFLEMKEKYCEQ